MSGNRSFNAESDGLSVLNDFLSGRSIESLIDNQPAPQAEAVETAPAEEVMEAAAEAPEAETPAQQVEEQETESDKDYNFRRLREQTQEYKAKLSELEQFKAEATAAFQQLYTQNQQLQQSLAQPKQVAPAAVVEDDKNLSDVEKEIRRQIREMSAGEIKRLEELRSAEEARLQAIQSRELISSAQSAIDEIMSRGKVDLGNQKDVFRQLTTELVFNAADKYQVRPEQTSNAIYQMLEMYHQAKKSQEKAVTKAVVEQGRKVSTPITKTAVSPSATESVTKIPTLSELRKQGYTGQDGVEILFKWQRDQLNKKR